MFYIALVVFVFTYFLIISGKIPSVLAALFGGFLMVVLQILPSESAFKAIDMNVIFLLVGMMIIVNITSDTGLFQWVAIKMAQFVKGRPFPLMLLLAIVTAVFSSLLDNVTTILLIAPVSILIAEQLEIDFIPFLIVEAIASNIGGTATLIGDPPNILIGSAAKLSFNEFIIHMTPVMLIILAISLFNFWIFFGKSMKVSRDLRAKVMEMDTSKVITNKPLLIKALIILFFIFAGFLSHSFINIEPSFVALGGAIFLMVISRKDPEDIFKAVEWPTLFFFIGLFILVEGLVEIGFISILADNAIKLTNGDLKKTSLLILWLSGVASAIIDNIPYTATLIPMIGDENTGIIHSMLVNHEGHSLEVIRYALWWALSLGACLGGNGTLIGASANVVAAGIASKSGKTLS
ncbi:MAG: ArsB/NhaD family transporter, partial [Fusobacteria bacterium]|nr:ArsB/NhaD family transporter [Fusobacteriota bacterium]